MAGKIISGTYYDNLNFPDNLVPLTSQVSETQKKLIQSGALDLVDHTDPFGRSCKAYAGFKNPHDDNIQEIAKIINQQKAGLPDGWNATNISDRVEVDGSLLGPGQPTRKLTDAEINDINFVEGAMKDITYLSNRQSGMCVDELGAGASPWTVLGNTSTYGTNFAIPTTPSYPGGVVVPGLSTYMSTLSSFNQLATTLSAVPNVSSGPCAFIEDAMGAIMKAGSILGEILAKIGQVVGILALAMGIIGLAKLLMELIKDDLKYLGNTIEKLIQYALAGLLGNLAKDPCMAYLMTAGIATFSTLKTLDLI